LAKTSIDDLLAALRTVGYLKVAVEKQEISIAALAAKLQDIEARLTLLEPGGKPT